MNKAEAFQWIVCVAALVFVFILTALFFMIREARRVRKEHVEIWNCEICGRKIPANPGSIYETGVEAVSTLTGEKVDLGIEDLPSDAVLENPELANFASGTMIICRQCVDQMEEESEDDDVE